MFERLSMYSSVSNVQTPVIFNKSCPTLVSRHELLKTSQKPLVLFYTLKLVFAMKTCQGKLNFTFRFYHISSPK